ncbi:MAG: hypothetical protein CSA62_00215 [Planctomycetota bacterium]|nr:MAG: hypothetical protein CSA62_00215 [Planctomycetota bacterium]
MPLTEWNEQTQRQIIEKYPQLEGKSEGIIFCAAALEDEPDLRLIDMREKGNLFAPELSFSPVSITSAQIAMGRRERKPRKPRGSRRRAASEAEGSLGTGSGAAGLLDADSGRLGKIKRKLGNALSVLDQFETARSNFVEMKSRISQLNPSVLLLLAELDDSARQILEQEGLLNRALEESEAEGNNSEMQGEAGNQY